MAWHGASERPKVKILSVCKKIYLFSANTSAPHVITVTAAFLFFSLNVR